MPKSNNLFEPFEFEEWAGFFEEFQNEPDRSAAILAAAFLDESLAKLIAGFIIENEKSAKELLRGPSSPAGTLYSRILFAYCMGLISADERHDLQIIRRIRNEFAHGLHGISFEQESIRDRCNELRLPKLAEEAGVSPKTDDPSQLFINSASMLATFLEYRRANMLDRRSSPPKFVVNPT